MSLRQGYGSGKVGMLLLVYPVGGPPTSEPDEGLDDDLDDQQLAPVDRLVQMGVLDQSPVLIQSLMTDHRSCDVSGHNNAVAPITFPEPDDPPLLQHVARSHLEVWKTLATQLG